MDALIFMVITLVMTVKLMFLDDRTSSSEVAGAAELQEQDTERIAKINDAFYECPDAFMLIYNALPVQRK